MQHVSMLLKSIPNPHRAASVAVDSNTNCIKTHFGIFSLSQYCHDCGNAGYGHNNLTL